MKKTKIDLKPEFHIQNYDVKQPTISLCMIVRDEEESLPTCLDSIKDYVDEIIIVDTGSTDSTVEIAKSYNAKVYHHPWENSFSKARNHSLSYATCDWILIMDADEEIEKKDAFKLRDVIKNDDVNLIFMPAFSKEKGCNNSSVYLIERVFKNHLDFHYDGIVHNALKYSGAFKTENVVFYHYGYHLSDVQMEEKYLRTSTLLKDQIENDPSNPMPHHFLAVAYSVRNMNDECINEALKAIKLFEDNNIKTDVKLLSYYTASAAFYDNDDLINAEYYAMKSVTSYQDYLDGYFMLSLIYMRQREYDKCIKATNRYLAILEGIKSNPTSSLRIPYNNIQNHWHAHTRLAIVYFEQDKESEGIQKLKETVKIADDKSDPYLSVVKYFLKQKNSILAEKVLKLRLKDGPENKKVLYTIAELYEEHNKPDEALNYFKRILDSSPGDIQSQYRIGLLHMRQGRYSDAINVLESLCTKQRDHIDALYNLGISYEQINDITRAKDTYNKISDLDSENAEVLIRLGSLFLNESYFTKAKEYFLKTIELDKYLLEANLAMSKIYLSLDDPESCVVICNKILECLDLPRTKTIDSLNDLSKLYIEIGTTLLKQKNETLAAFSFEIAVILEPDAIKAIQPDATNPVAIG